MSPVTRPPAIRMNTTRLPELTAMQRDRERRFRQHFKNIAQVSVTRKGQRPGHMLITVTRDADREHFEYDQDGHLIGRWAETRMSFDEMVGHPGPTNALLQDVD